MSTQGPNSTEDKRVTDSTILGKCGTEDPDPEADNKLSTEKSSLEAQEDCSEGLEKHRKILEPSDAFLELSRALQTADLSFDNCLYLGNISVRANKKDIVSLLLSLGDLLCFEVLIKDKQFRFQSGIAVFKDTASVKSALETKPFIVFKRKLKVSDLVSRNNASTLLTILVRKASQAAAEGLVPFQTSKVLPLEAPQQQGDDQRCSSQDSQNRLGNKPAERHMADKASIELDPRQMLRPGVINYVGSQVSPSTALPQRLFHGLHATHCVKNTDVMLAGLRSSREHETSDCFTSAALQRTVNKSAHYGELVRCRPFEVAGFDRREFLGKPASNVQANHCVGNLRFNPRVYSH